MSPPPKDGEDLELDWGGRTKPEDRGKAEASPSRELVQRFGGGSPPGTRPDPLADRMTPAIQAALEPLLQGTRFRVVQRRQLAEAVFDVEARNRYSVLDDNERVFLEATESGEGVGAFFARQLFRAGRPFTIELTAPAGQLIALRLKRPFRFFLSHLEVFGWNGELIGTVEQRWAWFARRLELCTPQGRVLAELYGPVFKPWTFFLRQGSRELGELVKQWSGLMTEAITNADDFRMQLTHGLDARLKQLVLAAAFLVDFVWFERRNR